MSREKRLQCLLSHSRSILFSCDPSMRYSVLFMSENVREILGYEAGEFIRDPELWMQRVHPEDLPRLRGALEGLKSGTVGTVEYRFLHSKGDYRWVRDEYRLLCDDAGTPREIIGNRVDITESKEREFFLRQINHDLEKRMGDVSREMEVQARHFQELDRAVSVLTDQSGRDRKELEECVLSNIRGLIQPCLATLRRSGLKDDQLNWVEILEEYLQEITFSFVKRLSENNLRLTPTELRIAGLLHEGKTTRDIAMLFNVSENAILFHRRNLRKKLGLKNKKLSLVSYLQSLDHQ